MKSKTKELNEVAKIVDRYGLGLISFVALIGMLGFQVFTSYRGLEEFKEMNKNQLTSMQMMSDRLTKLEIIVEHVLQDKKN